MDLHITRYCATCSSEIHVQERGSEYVLSEHERCAELVLPREHVVEIVKTYRRTASGWLQCADALREQERQRYIEALARIDRIEADQRRRVAECDEFLATK